MLTLRLMLKKIANIKSLPLNSKLAKAKAERIAIITVKIILNAVTMIVLIKYLSQMEPF